MGDAPRDVNAATNRFEHAGELGPIGLLEKQVERQLVRLAEPGTANGIRMHLNGLAELQSPCPWVFIEVDLDTLPSPYPHQAPARPRNRAKLCRLANGAIQRSDLLAVLAHGMGGPAYLIERKPKHARWRCQGACNRRWVPGLELGRLPAVDRTEKLANQGLGIRHRCHGMSPFERTIMSGTIC